jgi:hypothetical protein
MRTVCTTGLALLLCVHPLLADGPLTRSTAREASRLAAERVDGVDRSSWKPVRLLDPGAKIVVTTADGTSLRTFVAVDDLRLTVRNGTADEQIPVDDVLMIERQRRRGSGLAASLGTVGGIWLGSVLAYGIAENATCYSGCGAARLGMWAMLIGVPVAGGYGAWHATSHLTEEVIYRRASSWR